MDRQEIQNVPSFRPYFEKWSEAIEILRQNRLLNENGFIGFARNRGISVSGVVTGDPLEFHARGWLASDGRDEHGSPLYHPFRVCTLLRILEACRLPIASSSTLNRESFVGFIERILPSLPSLEEIGTDAYQWDKVMDLAILLEPIYWPVITGMTSFSGPFSQSEIDVKREVYKSAIGQLVAGLDPLFWKSVHEELRHWAARIDDNDGLYLLLRLSSWNRRERLTGAISGTLWIRHIAEAIRRAFEESNEQEWPEEDEANGWWHRGGRTNFYGSERPLDDVLQSRPYLAFHFGLFTGSSVRWYVEGDTEFYAILQVLPNPAKSGIELVNLRGNLGREKGGIAMKLSDGLAQDRELRRFSIISFDTDVAANTRLIRSLIGKEAIVGFIAAHTPDFEFANFTLEELVEIAARLDEAAGVLGNVLRQGDWTGITGARAFEARYHLLSNRRGGSLKGSEWGQALANFASEVPKRLGDKEERPFWHEMGASLRSRIANYDFQKDHFTFDRETFEAIEPRRAQSQ